MTDAAQYRDIECPDGRTYRLRVVEARVRSGRRYAVIESANVADGHDRLYRAAAVHRGRWVWLTVTDRDSAADARACYRVPDSGNDRIDDGRVRALLDSAFEQQP